MRRCKLWSDRRRIHWALSLSLSIGIASSNPIGPISDVDPSSIARVSGRGAVAVSRLCAWWWGFRWRRKALSLMRVFSLGFLILGFALALPFDDWGGRVFVLGFFILFYFIFYILYFINFYKFILIFYFFKNTFGFV